MIHYYQILNMVQDKKHFVNLFNDLSFELDEMGYRDFPSELIDDMLSNHFGIQLECKKQLEKVTKYILEKQGKLHYSLSMYPHV